MPIAHFSDLHKASVSLALGCIALLSPITMADSAAIDAPAEVLKLDELKSVDVLQVRNPADYNAYPAWPRGDHANGNDRITNDKAVWQANWWTSSEPKAGDGSWKLICSY